MEASRRNLARRQQCACLIQEIGSRLKTTQVVINASLYYMHHFYEVFTPEAIKPIMVALASFYIACKTEDFSRKLLFLVKAAYDALRKPMPNENSDTYKRIVQNIHSLEATILMVIGFQTLEVKQPHVILINVIRENKFPKEISHTSYYICTNILHLTTLVLRHSMEAIAATSLYIAAKWNGSDIKCANGEWYHMFSPKLTLEEIKNMADEFTLTFQECDAKIKDQLRLLLKSRRLDRLAREDPNMQQRKLNESQAKQNCRVEKRSHETPPPRGVQRPGQPIQHSRSSGEIAFRQSQPQQHPVRNGYGEPDSKMQRLDRGVFSPQSQPFQMMESAHRQGVRPDAGPGLNYSHNQSGPRYGGSREGSVDSRWQGDNDPYQQQQQQPPQYLINPATGQSMPLHRGPADRPRDSMVGGHRYPVSGHPQSNRLVSSSSSSRSLQKNDLDNLF
ncbi:hypothetical protein AAHC03_012870 [Spirometra sp. Aus1]